MASPVCVTLTQTKIDRLRNEFQVWHRLMLFITRLKTHVVSGAAIVSNPGDLFLHIYFCPRLTGCYSELDPKGWPLNQFSLRGLGGAVCSGRKQLTETWPAFGSGCLGDLSIPSTGASGWLNSSNISTKSVCISMERTSVQVRTCPFSRWEFLIHRQFLGGSWWNLKCGHLE